MKSSKSPRGNSSKDILLETLYNAVYALIFIVLNFGVNISFRHGELGSQSRPVSPTKRRAYVVSPGFEPVPPAYAPSALPLGYGRASQAPALWSGHASEGVPGRLRPNPPMSLPLYR